MSQLFSGKDRPLTTGYEGSATLRLCEVKNDASVHIAGRGAACLPPSGYWLRHIWFIQSDKWEFKQLQPNKHTKGGRLIVY